MRVAFRGGWVSSIFDEVKQDAIKVDFRGINKFYGERIKQQFFFKEDFTSLPFDKISMRFSWRLSFVHFLVTLAKREWKRKLSKESYYSSREDLEGLARQNSWIEQ